jgi:LacI family transcriptional regulator
MRDIAADMNVSVVTVSKVLRNQGKISTATRKRVLAHARKLNYQMNWVARSLVTRRTFTIGLLLPEFTHPFFAEIAKVVAQKVRAHGYHVIISYSEEDPELEISEADSLLARQVDGLIIASVRSSHGHGIFERIRDRKIPFVLIDRPIEGLQASFVGVDDFALGKLATEHLIEQGCTRIAHLRGPRIGIADARVEGYSGALRKFRLRVPSHYVVFGGHSRASGHAGMLDLLQLQPPPDAVFCYNDLVAIGAIKAIIESNLRVPQDVCVVGAGNVLYSDILAVPLTTIDQGTAVIGERAAELLLERMSSKSSFRPKRVLIPPKLVWRESSRRIPCPKSRPE